MKALVHVRLRGGISDDENMVGVMKTMRVENCSSFRSTDAHLRAEVEDAPKCLLSSSLSDGRKKSGTGVFTADMSWTSRLGVLIAQMNNLLLFRRIHSEMPCVGME